MLRMSHDVAHDAVHDAAPDAAHDALSPKLSCPLLRNLLVQVCVRLAVLASEVHFSYYYVLERRLDIVARRARKHRLSFSRNVIAPRVLFRFFRLKRGRLRLRDCKEFHKCAIHKLDRSVLRALDLCYRTAIFELKMRKCTSRTKLIQSCDVELPQRGG